MNIRYWRKSRYKIAIRIRKMKDRIIAIIPARGGSKKIPRKNIKLLCGKPLIAYTIITAKKSKYLDNFYVSMEDEEIAEILRRYGAEIIKRPEELAKDESPTIDAIIKLLRTEWSNEN